MKNKSSSVIHIENEMHGTLKSYVIGFILSIVLTLASFMLVSEQALAVGDLILTIVGLAVAQVLVQLFFFLHLGSDSKPYWNLTVFLFMLVIMVILVAGSLWIMYNLDYYMVAAE